MEVSGRSHVLVGLYIQNGRWVLAPVPASHSRLRDGPRGLDRGRGVGFLKSPGLPPRVIVR